MSKVDVAKAKESGYKSMYKDLRKNGSKFSKTRKLKAMDSDKMIFIWIVTERSCARIEKARIGGEHTSVVCLTART